MTKDKHQIIAEVQALIKGAIKHAAEETSKLQPKEQEELMHLAQAAEASPTNDSSLRCAGQICDAAARVHLGKL